MVHHRCRMAMPMSSIVIPSPTSTAPAHASVAKNISAAPTNTSSTDKNRLADLFLNIKKPNDASEHVLSFHLKHDQLLNHLDKRGAPPRQYRARDGCRLL